MCSEAQRAEVMLQEEWEGIGWLPKDLSSMRKNGVGTHHHESPCWDGEPCRAASNHVLKIWEASGMGCQVDDKLYGKVA
jgi:hypothetical protein